MGTWNGDGEATETGERGAESRCLVGWPVQAMLICPFPPPARDLVAAVVVENGGVRLDKE